MKLFLFTPCLVLMIFGKVNSFGFQTQRGQLFEGAKLVWIPDEIFRSFLKTKIYTVFYNDLLISNHPQVRHLTHLALNAFKDKKDSTMVSSLSGIEYFVSLRKLICNNQDLSVIDISKNTELMILNCSNNKIVNLDLSNNTLLVNLSCSYNKIKNLDFSKLAYLNAISCAYNELETLDMSHNKRVRSLVCIGNKIKKLELVSNEILTDLHCENNPLILLDIRAMDYIDEHLEFSIDSLEVLKIHKRLRKNYSVKNAKIFRKEKLTISFWKETTFSYNDYVEICPNFDPLNETCKR